MCKLSLKIFCVTIQSCYHSFNEVLTLKLNNNVTNILWHNLKRVCVCVCLYSLQRFMKLKFDSIMEVCLWLIQYQNMQEGLCLHAKICERYKLKRKKKKIRETKEIQ